MNRIVLCARGRLAGLFPVARIFAILLAFLAGSPAFAQESDEVRIQRLLRDLDDDKAEVRETAERALVEIGKPAIDALKKAKESGSAEARARAGHALREIKSRLGLWEFDPLKEVEKVIPATFEIGGATAKYDGKVTAVASPDLERLIPGWRFFEAAYVAERGSRKVLAAIDIDKGVLVLGSAEIEHSGRPAPLGKIFLDAGIVAKSDEERRAVARIWVLLVSSEDLLAKESWWGGLETKPLEGGGVRVVVTRHHGKTGSWSDVYTLKFDGSGRMTNAEYSADFH